jgi:hypothetical protein
LSLSAGLAKGGLRVRIGKIAVIEALRQARIIRL